MQLIDYQQIYCQYNYLTEVILAGHAVKLQIWPLKWAALILLLVLQLFVWKIQAKIEFIRGIGTAEAWAGLCFKKGPPAFLIK
jgi:hypothetical protein